MSQRSNTSDRTRAISSSDPTVICPITLDIVTFSIPFYKAWNLEIGGRATLGKPTPMSIRGNNNEKYDSDKCIRY